MREGGGGKRKEGRFSPSALSLFRFHLSPFPPETPYTQAITIGINLFALLGNPVYSRWFLDGSDPDLR